MMLLLPTVGDAPRLSPDLLFDTPTTAAVTAPVLAPWMVPTLAMESTEALTLLLGRLPPNSAASLRFLSEVALLALDLAVRGRVLPGLAHDPDSVPEPRWLAVPGAPDLERLRSLVAALPGVLRVAQSGPAAPTSEPATVVLERILGGLVDALARLAAPVIGPMLTARSRRRTTPTEAWLAGLAAPVPHSLPDPPATLVRPLAAWHAAAAVGSRRLRACFQLQAPPDDAPDHWRLEVLLQSAMDPSLQVRAASIWSAGPDAASILERALGDPQERLLAELGRASRLYPALVDALRQPHPTGLDLDPVGAHAFLSDTAPLMAEAGFGVLMPSWWRSGRPRLAARIRATSTGQATSVAGAGLGMESLVAVDWQVALGDQVLDFQELQELAALKAPLVRLRGQWVELRPEDLVAAARLMDRAGGSSAGTLTAAQVLRLGTGIDDAAVGLPVVGVTADGWLGALLEAGDTPKERTLPRVHAPDGFAGTLRPYQLRGLGWLESMSRSGLGACLADDMGLGKTAQLIALLTAERDPPRPPPGEPSAHQSAPTLVICPMSVVGNWGRELARFAPDLAVHVHHGPERLAGAQLAVVAPTIDVVLTTYGLVTRDRETLAAIPWGRIVLDEAQAIKNSGARQSVAVRSLAAPSRVALTGTPVENRLSELWSIMEFLNPGLLGSANGFRRRFEVPIEKYRDADAAARLRRATAPFILRRLKSDRSIIRDLPSKIETTVDCQLTREQATLYRAIVDDMLARIDDSGGIERRGLVLTTMLRLKQVCNHPAHLLGDGSPLAGRSGKFARLDELIEEVLAEGDRALLFTQFAEFGGMLQTHLRERFRREVLYLHGGMSRPARDASVARFEGADGALPVRALAEGRGHGPQPHRGQPRVPRRPLVEPGRGGPGHRPCLPHRPEEVGAGAQARLRRHVGGAHRNAHRLQAGTRGHGGGHGRTVADGTLDGGDPGPCRALCRRGGRLMDPGTGSVATSRARPCPDP